MKHGAGKRRIGLTGGIGMGKTTISDYLATRQIPVLDADVYSREAVQPGTAVFQEIVDRYGTSIVLPDGTLDRQRLGSIIFSSASEKIWLEQQIHPFVRDRMETELQRLVDSPVILLVIPLLFEARMTDLVNEIWVVRSSLEQQKQRLQQRDRLNPTQIQARIDGQTAIERKVQQADAVIDNSQTIEDLYRQVDEALGST
jgi:dephospho-CoA kinase